MAAPPSKTAISGSPSRAAANAGFGALYDYLIGLLGSTGNALEARTALGTDVYKKVPVATAQATGEILPVTAGFTLDVGAAPGSVFGYYNEGGSTITITQGAGLTLRYGGSTTTGNRTLAPGGIMSVWARSSNLYVVTGAGLA